MAMSPPAVPVGAVRVSCFPFVFYVVGIERYCFVNWFKCGVPFSVIVRFRNRKDGT